MAGGSDEVYLQSGILRWTDLSSKVSAVCHLALLSDKHPSRTTSEASGFLAKCMVDGRQETVIVTNNHFIQTKEDASRVKATFHFDGDEKNPKCVALNPDMFFTTSTDLDYTMVGICESFVNDLQSELNVLPVKLEEKKIYVKVDDIVHIPQHPGGKQKRFSSSVVKFVNDLMVCYKADTAEGSSGSPVLCIVNDNIVVLALHKTGGSILSNGQVVNKGILISAILDDVNGNAGPNSATSPGNESGAFFNDIPGTTNQRRPVLQPRSTHPPTIESPVPSEDQPNNVSLKVKTGLVQETLSPSSTPSSIPSSKASPSLQVIMPTQEMQDPQQLQIKEGPCLVAFTQRELIRIAHRISEAWQQVAKETNLFKAWEITNIRVSSSLHDEVLKADKMLNDFKSRLGTRETLAEALKLNGKVEEAQHVLSGYFLNNAE